MKQEMCIVHFEVKMKQEQEVNEFIAALNKGEEVSVTSLWKSSLVKYVSHEFYDAVSEIKIDPARKRVMILLDLLSYNSVSFEEDVAEIRLYRQVYDFLTLFLDDPRLSTFTPFIESIYLLCRRQAVDTDGENFFYPFLRVAVRIDELRDTIGSYFNPRKFPSLAAVVFKKGSTV